MNKLKFYQNLKTCRKQEVKEKKLKLIKNQMKKKMDKKFQKVTITFLYN